MRCSTHGRHRTLLHNGDTLTFKLGSGTTVTATFDTAGTNNTNTFDNAAAPGHPF